jgi:hypothetical protein
MNKHSTSYIGLGVHKDSIAIAVADPGWAQAAQVRGHRDNGAVFSY